MNPLYSSTPSRPFIHSASSQHRRRCIRSHALVFHLPAYLAPLHHLLHFSTSSPSSPPIRKDALRLPSLAKIGLRDFVRPRYEPPRPHQFQLLRGLPTSGHCKKRTLLYHIPQGPIRRPTEAAGTHSPPPDLPQEVAAPMRVSRQKLDPHFARLHIWPPKLT